MCETSEQKADVNVGSNALLACPFCGSANLWPSKDTHSPNSYNPKYWHFIECECGAQGAEADEEIDAIKLWNKRAS